jgi:hypothetical protein
MSVTPSTHSISVSTSQKEQKPPYRLSALRKGAVYFSEALASVYQIIRRHVSDKLSEVSTRCKISYSLQRRRQRVGWRSLGDDYAYRLNSPGFEFRKGQTNLLISKPYIPALRPTHQVTGGSFPEVMREKVKNEWSNTSPPLHSYPALAGTTFYLTIA